jgi:DNA-binding transcriptional ArsR family regulator
MLAERERTGQELAPLVGVTQSAVSRHLRKLHEAGLLTARRDGYYTLYGLDQDKLESLSPALLQFVNSTSSDDQAD